MPRARGEWCSWVVAGWGAACGSVGIAAVLVLVHVHVLLLLLLRDARRSPKHPRIA